MLPDPVLHLLHHQWGLIADRQLLVAEPDANRRRAIQRSPEIARLGPRVLRHRAVPPTVEQSLMHAALDAGPGGVLWAKTASSHWGFGRFRRLPAHVAIERGRSHTGPRVGQLHVVRCLPDDAWTFHHDLPVARPEETILWLAGMWTHRVGHELAERFLARTLDQAWRQELIDGHALHALAERSGGRGRSGIVVLRNVLETRGPGYLPAGSGLEERFEEIVPGVVRRDLRRQVRIDSGRRIHVVDFELVSRPVIVEINGEAWHTSLTDRAADDARYQRLLDQGYSVVVFWEFDLWHDADRVRQAVWDLWRRPDEVPTLHRPTRAPWDC